MLTSLNDGQNKQNNIPVSIDVQIHSFEGIPFEHNWASMHHHEYIEILYALKGDFFVMHNGEILNLFEGSMFIANSHEPHTIKHTDENGKLVSLEFMPEVLFSLSQTITEMEHMAPYVFENFGNIRVFDAKILECSLIPKEFQYLNDEYINKNFGYELALRSSIIRIFSWIIRYWYQKEGSPTLPTNQKATETSAKIREYVNIHYADATLHEAAKYCNLSYSYFSRVFNQYMNMNFSDYLSLVRVNKSLKLLASSDMSITEIALSLGFSSTSYYIQVFKKIKNISPGEFRKLFRNN